MPIFFFVLTRRFMSKRTFPIISMCMWTIVNKGLLSKLIYNLCRIKHTDLSISLMCFEYLTFSYNHFSKKIRHICISTEGSLLLLAREPNHRPFPLSQATAFWFLSLRLSVAFSWMLYKWNHTLCILWYRCCSLCEFLWGFLGKGGRWCWCAVAQGASQTEVMEHGVAE